MTKLTLANNGMDLHHQQLLSPQQGMTQDDLIAGLMSGEPGPLPTGLDSIAYLVFPVMLGDNDADICQGSL